MVTPALGNIYTNFRFPVSLRVQVKESVLDDRHVDGWMDRRTGKMRIAVYSRLQTIDKVGQLFGRGLVSEDNRLMKSLNHDTCHLSRHDCDVKKWQTIRTPTLLCCFIF